MWSDIISGVKAIGGWVQLNRENRRLHQKELVDGLSEPHRAANLTRAFAADASLYGYEEAEIRFREISVHGNHWQVSEAWRKVGDKLARLSDDERIRDVVRDLYEWCFAKAQYWADPQGWRESGVDIEESGVDIEFGKLVDEAARAIEHVRESSYR